MIIHAAQILALDDRYNNKIRRVKDTLTSRVNQMHTSLRLRGTAPDRLTRSLDAMVLNAVWGFKVGAQQCLGTSLMAPYVFGLHRGHKGHFAPKKNLVLSAYVGGFLVGDYRPIQRTTGDGRVAHLYKVAQSRGLVGLGIAALQQKSTSLTDHHRPSLASACRWSAALLSVASSVGRTAIFAISIPVALSVSLWTGAVAGAAAGVWQAFCGPTDAIVDFKGATDRLFAQAGRRTA